jgi:hypothetical protein
LPKTQNNDGFTVVVSKKQKVAKPDVKKEKKMDSDQKYQKKAEKKAKILIEKVLNQISSNEISQLEEKPFYPKKETHRQDICEAC